MDTVLAARGFSDVGFRLVYDGTPTIDCIRSQFAGWVRSIKFSCARERRRQLTDLFSQTTEGRHSMFETSLLRLETLVLATLALIVTGCGPSKHVIIRTDPQAGTMGAHL